MGKLALICDFDGTISTQDTLQYVLTKYAPESWLAIEENWRNGIISTKECLQQQFALISSDKITQIQNDLTQSIQISPGFQDALKTCKENDVFFAILSDGFTNFINPLLSSGDFNLEQIYANRLDCSLPQLSAQFPYANNKHPSCANCKGDLIKQLRLKHDLTDVIYVGDGRSDRCAITSADTVLAKDYLAEYCLENKFEYVSYSDFNDVYSYIKGVVLC